jgi:hypothetical protein
LEIARFSYDKKEPIHIWEPENSQQKEEAARETLNQELDPICRQEWKMNSIGYITPTY